jgi:hypothetical protein
MEKEDYRMTGYYLKSSTIADIDRLSTKLGLSKSRVVRFILEPGIAALKKSKLDKADSKGSEQKE